MKLLYSIKRAKQSLPHPPPLPQQPHFAVNNNNNNNKNIFIYLLYENPFQPTPGGRINAKERKVRRVNKRKGIKPQRVKSSTPSRATDVLIGEEEQNGKQKRTKRKKQGADPQPSYPGASCWLLPLAGIIQ